jgi:hypothetical protein
MIIRILHEGDTTKMRFNKLVTLEEVLIKACQTFDVEFEEHSLVSAEVKDDQTSLLLDHTISFMLESAKITDYRLKPCAKSYTTMTISENNQDVAVFSLLSGTLIMMAATKEKLIYKAVDACDIVDKAYIQSLLLTYRHFTTPLDFFGNLIDFFNAELPPEANTEDIVYFNQFKEPTQRRVIEIFNIWICEFWEDFENIPMLMSELRDFAAQLSELDRFRSSSEMIMKVFSEQTLRQEEITALHKSVSRKSKTIVSIFEDLDPISIAEQLCVYNFNIFRNINPIEYLNIIWRKKNDEFAATPNLDFFSARFEMESYWVATEILFTKDLKSGPKNYKSF